MPVLNRIAGFAEEMKAWRRHLHMNPETRFDCHDTAAFVVERLREFGVDEIHEGWAETGVIAVIEGQGPGPSIGLRADMDALPMEEKTGLPHASRRPGAMHACGHDGHTAMLLGAAKYLAETRNFSGRAVLIFQPAEEWGSGARVMVDGGMMERFGIAEVYALHNDPGAPVGHFSGNPGPIMAGIDEFEITITGTGGHAAYPHQTNDPITAGLALAQGINAIRARNANPVDDLVVAITRFQAGTSNNITPDTAFLSGTVRWFNDAARAGVEARMRALCAGTEAAYGLRIALDYQQWEMATVNLAEETAFAFTVAEEIGTGTEPDMPPSMGGEDFAYMLKHRPGSYLFVGNGPSAGLHHPEYDFNDETAPFGASYFARLIERRLPV